MSSEPHFRRIDVWLKWVALVGPIFCFMFGVCSGAVVTFQTIKVESRRIALMESWKERQEEFNKETITAIAVLKEIVKRVK